MEKRTLLAIVALAVFILLLIFGCQQETQGNEQNATLVVKPLDLAGIQARKTNFNRFYSLESITIRLRAPQYNLPLETSNISNFNDASQKLRLKSNAINLLRQNGFVVIDNPFNPRASDITSPYKVLKEEDIPIFITTDSLLHLYHVQFDETLRVIEERELYPRFWRVNKKLFEYSLKGYYSTTGDVKEAHRRNAAYFATTLRLLAPRPWQVCDSRYTWGGYYGGCVSFNKEEASNYSFDVPDFLKNEVEAELSRIDSNSGFAASPIFKYKEDYSQYVPRGHYTRSEKLKNYFKAMMWAGRMSFLLKGGCQNCLVSEENAKLQTIGATLIASKFAQDAELKSDWERIYSVTAFYVGTSDDLGPYEYVEAINEVFGGSFDESKLTEDNIARLKAKLAEYRSPKIYGGTGDCAIAPPFTPQQADECLENTKGFRLMGQRFVPDSYIFSNLVGVYTGLYKGNKKPFTLVYTPEGPIRGFPRGLDTMALLGSKRAKEILAELDDSNYANYATQYEKMEREFNNFTEADWNKNLYWAWLFALKPLLKEYGAGYPTFMQTRAWRNKALTTALASWAELRHDTILYAKQSYTERVLSIMLPEKPVVGYVEPDPEFYNRLLALTRMTKKGLREMGVSDEYAQRRLDSLEYILQKLVDISITELENKELSYVDYEFIKNFGEALDDVVGDVDEKSKKTTIIADVHTDGNTRQVLEEGVGYVKLIVVAYKLPDGRIVMGAGPVMSYYEFKHPMGDRLTDERWEQMLASNPPSPPEWVDYEAH